MGSAVELGSAAPQAKAPAWVLTEFAAAADGAWQPAAAWLQAGMLHVGAADLAIVVSALDNGAYCAVTGGVGWSYRVAAEADRPRATALCTLLAAQLAPYVGELEALLQPTALAVYGRQGGARTRLHQDFQRLARGPRLDYPVLINLESYTSCPAACTFCTYPTLERQGTRMSDALLDKIINDLKEIPREIRFALCPFLISEPFADKRLHGLLARLEQEVPNAAVCLVTTGTLLDAKQLAHLQARRNIAELVISLNFHEPAAYQAAMGIPWARTWANVTALHRASREAPLPFTVLISRVRSNDTVDSQFRAFVHRELPGFEVRMIDRHGWLGHVQAPARDLEALPCTQWFELKVTATGQVALCCQDSHAEHVLGDINTLSLLEIYNQPAARARRESLSARSSVASCHGCGFNRVVGNVDPDYFRGP